MARSLINRVFTRAILSLHFLRLRNSVRVQLDAMEATIEILENEKARSLKHGATDFAQIYDASLFVALLSYDLAVLRAHHTPELRESRKNFYSRQLALQMYEAFKDLPSVFGKPFHQASEKIGVRLELITRVGQHISAVSQLSKKYSKELEIIRDFSAAHRDLNASKQLAVIRKVDDGKIANIAFELNEILNHLVVVLAEFVKHMGKPLVIIRNIKLPSS